MAHPYGDRTSFNVFLSTTPVAKLLDLDRDGTEDASLFDQIREDADRMIDARLAQAYVTPFTITTPGVELIGTISNHLTAALLFAKRNPDGPDAKFHLAQAEGLLNGLLKGDLELPGGTPVESGAGRVVVAFDADTPAVAGRDETTGVSRMRNW